MFSSLGVVACRAAADSLVHGRRRASTLLQEVGKLQTPLDPMDTNLSYKTGQLFLHKQLGYRGIILLPWKTKIFEATTPTVPVADGEKTIEIMTGDIENPSLSARSPELFYNVLVDAGDSSYVRSNVDGVSFLGRDVGDRLVVFSMPGIDYVHNADILPYRLTESEDDFSLLPFGNALSAFHAHRRRPPITHDLFSRFFEAAPPARDAKEPANVGTRTLIKWRKRNLRWLKPEVAYRACTGDVRITVVPFYMGSHGGERGDTRYWWRYILRVENLGEKNFRIKRRNWTVSSRNGTYDKKMERGLDGRHAVLSKWNPSFQTTSYCSFSASAGSIWGHLELEDNDSGEVIRCQIPQFQLKSEKSSEERQ